MIDYYYELNTRVSCEESLAALETDIHHANNLAASIPRAKNSPYFQMKLVCSQLAPFLLLLLQWMNCSYTCMFSSSFSLFHIVIHKIRPDGKRKLSSVGRKATIQEFYNVILPSLQRLHSDSTSHESMWESNQFTDDRKRLMDRDFDREDECGICLEPCTKMVVPSCCHSMCINCYRDWNTRSESCPFCRGSLKRVNSSDLWVLPCSSDRVDTKTVLKEDTLRFLLYINDLPKEIPDALFLMYYEYLI